jgi:hypothetical protein
MPKRPRAVPNHGSFCEKLPVVVVVGSAKIATPGTVTTVGNALLPLCPVPRMSVSTPSTQLWLNCQL